MCLLEGKHCVIGVHISSVKEWFSQSSITEGTQPINYDWSKVQITPLIEWKVPCAS